MIGADLGGTKLLAGVVDRNLDVHHRALRRARGNEEAEVLDTVLSAVQEARDAFDGDLLGVGFGIPSLVDQERGTALSTVHLPLAGVPFRDVMAERLGLPVEVDNDVNAALLAEHRGGAAEGARHAVMVALGTGIGSALLLEGRLYRGLTGAGAEIGHMVVDLHGPECQGACPGRGCLEVLASGTAMGVAGTEAARAKPESALGRRLAEGGEITGALVTELAHDGDPLARDVLEEIGRRLGAGLTGVVNIFNPEVVVLGGGALAAGELLLAPAREVVERRALPPPGKQARIVSARFGDESGMLGAALLALGNGRS